MKSSLVIPGAIIIGGLILAGAVYLTVKAPNPNPQTTNTSVITLVSSADHILGDPAAPVKIVEYSDFDCPHCKDFEATMHQVIANYGASGKVAWVMRDFALTEIHPNAKMHAEAAECVAKTAGNDAYWKFADSLFANQPTDPTMYAQLAQAAGADPKAVSSCIQQAGSNGIDAKIDGDRANAIAMGAQGTPFSVILATGQTPVAVSGAWDYDTLKQELDAVLAQIK